MDAFSRWVLSHARSYWLMIAKMNLCVLVSPFHDSQVSPAWLWTSWLRKQGCLWWLPTLWSGRWDVAPWMSTTSVPITFPLSGWRPHGQALRYEDNTFLCMLWCLQWGQSPTAAKPCSCICTISCSSSSAWPVAAVGPARCGDAVGLCPSGTSSLPIKLLHAVTSVSVVSWSSGRAFSWKLISGSKMF